MAKVLITIGDAAEAMDTLYPVYRVQEDGYEAVVAGPEARVYPLVMHEIPPGWDITREQPSYHLEATVAFRDVDPDDYDGLFLTGGRAPEYIRYDQDLIRIVRHFFEHDKPVAVVCHGAEIVATANVIAGKRMATIPKCKFDVEVCGATFVDEGCVRSGNMVSGRGWFDQHLYMPEFMRMLKEHSSARRADSSVLEPALQAGGLA
ncbi:MAG: DJ-1/PfpI family protein [Acidobacteriia bacterium]|nr:DJ-1/PfpI family protein [Terriglobia bacterium]MYG00708.1 DJ-1/PfpI family protein [Terriglobia bacterium]MYK10269.1 DJ-1/PfpI family protein [Terriglobia bacterium]